MSLPGRIWGGRRPTWLQGVSLAGFGLEAAAVALAAGPIAITLVAAFSDASLSQRGARFVGLQNFQALATDDAFWRSVGRTAAFGLFAAVLEGALGLTLAWLVWTRKGNGYIEEARPPKAVLAFMTPLLLPPVVIALVARLHLNGDVGFLPHALRVLGVSGIAPLSDVTWAPIMVLGIDAWQWSALFMLGALGAELRLPSALRHAAAVDGCGRQQWLVRVVLPLCMPTVAGLGLFRVADAFRELDKVVVLTGGGPGSATELSGLYVWRAADTSGRLGYASALSVTILGLLVAVLLAPFLSLALKRRG